MQHRISDLSAHYIICGYGRVGHEIVAGLRRRNRHVVAVDADATAFRTVQDLHSVIGDATDDAVLTAAGISTARGLVAGAGGDSTNLAIVLSARALNPEIRIVARANHPEAEAKLLRAGASRVVSPYAIGALRMATQLVSPGMLEFLDVIRDVEQVDLWIEEATVAAGSALLHRRVADVLPRSPGLPNLIAIRRASDGSFIANPPLDATLAPGDTLIVVGSRTHLDRLIAQAAGSAEHS
jgi:voltage-gated potassium channel